MYPFYNERQRLYIIIVYIFLYQSYSDSFKKIINRIFYIIDCSD